MLIFKIAHADEWRAARRDGIYPGSEKDREDGFLHFSTGEQLRETLERHYSGAKDMLVIAAFDADAFGDTLKWEPSRGGALFPHLYAELKTNLVLGDLHTHYQTLARGNFISLAAFVDELSKAHERR